MNVTQKIALAALIVMAGPIFLCFIFCACKVWKDEDETQDGRNDRRDEE